jgi:hypothetical protein
MQMNPGGTADAVAARGPQGENVISQVDRWPSPSAASRAVAAFGRPTGAACFESAAEQSLSAIGFPVDIRVDQERPPPAAGRDAVAYHLTALDRSAGAPQSEGSVVFFSRGRRSAQVIALRGGQQPFSRAVLADLAGSLAERIRGRSP